MVHSEQPDYTTQIKQILQLKKQGQDCTEEESGYIKQWIKKEEPIQPESDYRQILNDIETLFPCEFSEAYEEMDKDELINKILQQRPELNPDYLYQCTEEYLNKMYL